MASPLVVCYACDLAQQRVSLQHRARARCVRCHVELYRNRSAEIDRPIALAIAALGLLFLTNAFPLVALKLNGTTRMATLADAALGLYQQGYLPMAMLVALTTIVVPLGQVLATLYLLLPLRWSRQAPAQALVFRVLNVMRPWGLIEVFMLGTLVALVKLSSLADVLPGTALWSCVALMFSLTALSAETTAGQFWHWAERARP